MIRSRPAVHGALLSTASVRASKMRARCPQSIYRRCPATLPGYVPVSSYPVQCAGRNAVKTIAVVVTSWAVVSCSGIITTLVPRLCREIARRQMERGAPIAPLLNLVDGLTMGARMRDGHDLTVISTACLPAHLPACHFCDAHKHEHEYARALLPGI